MDKNNIKTKANVRFFAPDLWGELERFTHFWQSTYNFDKTTKFAAKGAISHFYKVRRLTALATRLIPSLSEDEEELAKSGFSSTKRANELAALIETIFCELYSCIDCTRQVIGFIYGNLPGITSNSTRKLFKNARNGKIDERVPIGIRKPLSNATWYWELLLLRDKIIHSDIGTCGRDKNTSKITYFHMALGTDDKVFIIEDVFSKINELTNTTNLFLGSVYRELNKTLRDKRVVQICSIFGNRVYTRSVSPVEAINFNNGICTSHDWFDKETDRKCPFADECGAYLNRGDRNIQI